jgi:tetratricopeptide (TPR) repeat protein
MNYTQNDYIFLGKQVAQGKYIRHSTFILSLLLALMAGMAVGRYLLPVGDFRLPAPGTEQTAPTAGGEDKERLNSDILRHEESLRRDPDNAATWTHLGDLYYDAGEAEKSVRAYERALSLKPGVPSTLVDCGVMYRKLKQYNKALEYFAKALAVDPRHEFALFNTGIVLYYDLQRRKEGADAWRRLVHINPQAKTPGGGLVVDMIKDHEAGRL